MLWHEYHLAMRYASCIILGLGRAGRLGWVSPCTHHYTRGQAADMNSSLIPDTPACRLPPAHMPPVASHQTSTRAPNAKGAHPTSAAREAVSSLLNIHIVIIIAGPSFLHDHHCWIIIK